MSALEDGRMVSLNVKDKCNKINASKTIPCIKKKDTVPSLDSPCGSSLGYPYLS